MTKIYVGPYFECHNQMVSSSVMASNICGNVQCRACGKPISDQREPHRWTHCPLCGSRLQSAQIKQQSPSVDVDLVTTELGAMMLCANTTYKISPPEFGQYRTDLWLIHCPTPSLSYTTGFRPPVFMHDIEHPNGLQFLNLAPHAIEADLACLNTHYKTEYDTLVRHYGDTNIMPRWGIIICKS